MPRHLIITLICILATAGIAHAENWITVYKSADYDLEIDQDRITRNGSMVEFWTEEYNEYNTVVDCQKQQFMLLKVWNPFMNKMTYPENSEWYAPENAGDEALLKYFCRGY